MAVVSCAEVQQHDVLNVLRVGVHVWECEPLQERVIMQPSIRRYDRTFCAGNYYAHSLSCAVSAFQVHVL